MVGRVRASAAEVSAAGASEGAASPAAAGASAAAALPAAGESPMNWRRFLRHLFTDHRSVKRAFPRSAMSAIEKAIGEEERRHAAELRFAVEASLPLGELLRGVHPRARAVECFSRLRVWDTEHNSGVLIYVQLADRRVEIVADRGIHVRTGDAAWKAICGGMQREFARGRFEEGAVLGIRAIGDLLAAHFPAGAGGDANELPDRPVVL